MLYQLWLEISRDPASIGYAEKTDLQVAALLNAKAQKLARASITGAELWENTVLAELKALAAAEREVYWGLVGMAALDVSEGSNSRNSLAVLFPAGTQTRTNLIALVQTPILASRAAILGLGVVETVHVWQVRTEFGG